MLPIATGGSVAHVLALDYALRPVLQLMDARHVVAGYFVVDKMITHKPGGGIVIDGDTESKLFQVVDAFVRALGDRALLPVASLDLGIPAPAASRSPP